MTTICFLGSATDDPCTKQATTETDFGAAVCEAHKAIFDLSWEADEFYLAEALLDEAIDEAERVGGRAAIPLLERARDEARQEGRRIEQEIKDLDPKRT